MDIDPGASTIGVIVVWFLKEVIVGIRKVKGGVSIDDKIDYLYSREKDRHAVEKYRINHNKEN